MNHTQSQSLTLSQIQNNLVSSSVWPSIPPQGPLTDDVRSFLTTEYNQVKSHNPESMDKYIAIISQN